MVAIRVESSCFHTHEHRMRQRLAYLLAKLYCDHKNGQFILRKIIKILATRCQILRLKCTKFDFGWGFAPGPAGGAYSQTPWLDLRGLHVLLRDGKGRERGGREGKEGDGEGNLPPVKFRSGYATDCTLAFVICFINNEISYTLLLFALRYKVQYSVR